MKEQYVARSVSTQRPHGDIADRDMELVHLPRGTH